MRFAATIVGLVIGIVVTFQACTAYGLSGIGESFGSEGAGELNQASAAGILTGLLIMVGAGFALPFPRVAAGIFVAAGLLGLAVGGTSDFSDQIVWGVIAFGLAALAFFGARSKRREDQVKAAERATVGALQAAAASAAAPTVPAPIEATKVCPDCAEIVKAEAKVCRFCRHDFTNDDASATSAPVADGRGRADAPTPEVVAELDRLLALRNLGEISADEHRRRVEQLMGPTTE